MPFRYALAALLVLAAPTTAAQAPGACLRGTASAELSLSDVRTTLFNGGSLFWRGGNPTYEVPKDGGVTAIFSDALWIAGTVGGELRAVTGDYGNWDLWPGPLDDGATLPDADDCSAFDRMYRIGAPEVMAYETNGTVTLDLAAWPVGLGAPAVDAQGAPVVPTSRDQVIDLEAGERPVVYGTETVFWVMNDVGNVHAGSGTPPMGIEVRVSAFSINDPDVAALDQSTFYRFEVVNRSTAPIEDLRLGWFQDFDLGNFSDDYIGSDPARGMMVGYNADDDDETGSRGYGTAPPALGFDVLSGAFGVMWVDDDGPPPPTDYDGPRVYRNLQSLWQDDRPLSRGRVGWNPNDPDPDVTRWLFDGDPTATDRYWSMFDSDAAPGDQPIQSGDRNGLVSAQPVTLAPGASHTVDIAVLFARGTDHRDSVTELRAASDLVQARYDDGSLFDATSGDLGLPPSAAPALIAPADGLAFMPPEQVTLDWTPVADADRYRVEYSLNPGFGGATVHHVAAPPVAIDFEALPQGSFEPVYWRVVPLNVAGAGPASETRRFTYGFEFTPGALTLSNGQFAFVEVAAPGGAAPCGPGAESTFGCDEVGGNAVYIANRGTPLDASASGTYALSSFGDGPEATLPDYAPHDFELRFTGSSIATHIFGEADDNETHRVPFEVWDIGLTPPGAPNDPSDDVRLVPVLFSDDGGDGHGVCAFNLDEVPVGATGNPFGVTVSDRIYAYYPATSYADFDAAAAPLVDAAPDGCYRDTDGALVARIDVGRGRPIQRVVVADLADSGSVAALQGTVIRFYTNDPQPVADEAAPPVGALALTVAPNPSRGSARVSFVLPEPGIARVRVVDVLGREVAVLADGERAAGRHTVALPARLAAGVYVVTVEAGDARASRTLTVVR